MNGQLLIETQHLVKKFGEKLAVDDVSFQVSGGEIFGFLGPNGAGKTTTIKMIVGLLQPTSGTVKVAGFDVQKEPLKAKSSNGFVPDEPNLYPKLTARELLRFIGDLYRLDAERVRHRTEELLRLFDLENAGDDTIDSYSHGMQQKTALATALLHDPKGPGLGRAHSWFGPEIGTLDQGYLASICRSRSGRLPFHSYPGNCRAHVRPDWHH